MPSDWSLDVAGTPEGTLARLALAINQRPRRMFGILPTRDEFVGVIEGAQFEIWERRQRAIHAVGRARGRGGGTRIEVAFRVTPPARRLLVLFFALYAVGAIGAASRTPTGEISAVGAAVASVGAAVLAGLFYAAAGAQRRMLRAFLTSVLGGASDDRRGDRG